MRAETEGADCKMRRVDGGLSWVKKDWKRWDRNGDSIGKMKVGVGRGKGAT